MQETIGNSTDRFAEQNMPTAELFPDFVFEEGEYCIAGQINCAYRFLDKHIEEGRGDAMCMQSPQYSFTYKELYELSNQIAHVLVDDLELVPGNRVLLRSANNPMLVACWFAVIKAGGIVVTTMPLLRAKELETIVEQAQITHALCGVRLGEEMDTAKCATLKHSLKFDGTRTFEGPLVSLAKNKPKTFENYKSDAQDVALIGFTSGTTGIPKMTAHYHRDLLNICEAFPKYSLQPKPSDVFAGSPPIGFTFGLGGLVLFPMYYGASAVLLEVPSPENLLTAIQEFGITICFTAPTAWRVLTQSVKKYNLSSLRKCVSAGETLPLAVWQDWFDATGIKIIDGIGATEMLHIFISSHEGNMKPGATGLPITGYEAKIVDKNNQEVPANTPGRLAVRGITGCRYLNRVEKQKEYVQQGWNITGDVFRKDEDGYFWFVARGDDMIISSGYNIAAIEVENVLIKHENVLECAVVGRPDAERGMLVCAHIVLKEGVDASPEKAKEIQDWFKQNAAPYKYPRIIEFANALPKTQTGKIQRFKLK